MQAPDDPVKYDSFRYYGPNGLYKSWSADQRKGRDTWIFWSGGNQKFLRQVSHLGGKLSVPLSVEWLRLLDSQSRDQPPLRSMV